MKTYKFKLTYTPGDDPAIAVMYYSKDILYNTSTLVGIINNKGQYIFEEDENYKLIDKDAFNLLIDWLNYTGIQVNYSYYLYGIMRICLTKNGSDKFEFLCRLDNGL